FLDEMNPDRAGATPGNAIAGQQALATQLWELAQRARHDISQIAQRIAQVAVEPVVSFEDNCDLRQLARSVVVEMSSVFPGQRLRLDAGTELPQLKCDADSIKRLLKILVNYAAKLGSQGGNVTVTAKE